MEGTIKGSDRVGIQIKFYPNIAMAAQDSRIGFKGWDIKTNKSARLLGGGIALGLSGSRVVVWCGR